MSYPFIIAELIANIFILGLGIAIWIGIIGVFSIVVQILVEKFTTKGNHEHLQPTGDRQRVDRIHY
tara:strand:- start:182 stop:379 length:198 start_codon:yes stop_codon:yes gene_type:complete